MKTLRYYDEIDLVRIKKYSTYDNVSRDSDKERK